MLNQLWRCVSLGAILGASMPLLRAEPPAPLAAAMAARDQALLRTARIEYAQRSVVVEASGERVEKPARYYTWRCAGADYVSVDHGDEDGVVMRDPEGRPRNDLTYNGAQNFLVKGDEVWLHVDESPVADIFGMQRADLYDLHDLRRLGLDPVTLGQDLEAACTASGLRAPEYRTSMEAGLYVVSTTIGPGEVRWWIDADRGWNVVRTAVMHGGQVTRSMEVKLAPSDGFWFPQEFTQSRRAADGREFTTVLSMLNTEFNRPDHPQRLAPSDIGVEPGTALNYQERDDLMQLIWDGQKAISVSEYTARIKDGSLRNGPTVERELARLCARRLGQVPEQNSAKPPGEDAASATRPAGVSGVQPIKRFEPEWEVYTRQFIIKHRLDADRARKAWEICADCEKAARSYLDTRRKDVEDWQQQLEASRSPSTESKAADAEKLERRRSQLVAPIERIFEDRLKPGLEKLKAKQAETAPTQHK